MKRAWEFLRGGLLPALLLSFFGSSIAYGQVDLTQTEAAPGEHPLAPAMRIASAGLQHIDQNVKDFSCTLVKRERLDGELGEHQYAFCKVRHEPFSVYLYFQAPEAVRTNEAMFVEGRNNGKARCRTGKGPQRLVGWVSLDPNARMMMNGQRYPITMTGIRKLTERMIEVGTKDMQFGECEVKYFRGAKINGRSCMCIQVTHPTPRQQFEYHVARIFIDEELTVPIRYAAYSWPKQQGGAPVLEEEYTYLNLKINNGFTDADFDDQHPNFRSAGDNGQRRGTLRR
ncbi:MAG: DUF1571 domain-containing protein [Planctomycetota bacterium]|nr:MAG: DUF1571 domain-containing protein [Planctomycetota bacterium]